MAAHACNVQVNKAQGCRGKPLVEPARLCSLVWPAGLCSCVPAIPATPQLFCPGSCPCDCQL